MHVSIFVQRLWILTTVSNERIESIEASVSWIVPTGALVRSNDHHDHRARFIQRLPNEHDASQGLAGDFRTLNSGDHFADFSLTRARYVLTKLNP